MNPLLRSRVLTAVLLLSSAEAFYAVRFITSELFSQGPVFSFHFLLYTDMSP